MTRYIKTKDGRFAGSIGDGAHKTPPVKPLKAPRGVSLAPAPVASGRDDLLDLYDRFQELTHQREITARDGIEQLVRSRYPHARSVIVEEDDMSAALNGQTTTLIPVRIEDATGAPLWEQSTVRTETTGFAAQISELAQVVRPGYWEEIDSPDTPGRRYKMSLVTSS